MHRIMHDAHACGLTRRFTAGARRPFEHQEGDGPEERLAKHGFPEVAGQRQEL